MAKRTTTSGSKKTSNAAANTATADAVLDKKTADVAAAAAVPAAQVEADVATEAAAELDKFVFRFWELGEVQATAQALEVGHDGAPIDVFVFDAPNFEAFKLGQAHQYIGGFGLTAARHLFHLPFDGQWFLVARPASEGAEYELAYRLINLNQTNQ